MDLVKDHLKPGIGNINAAIRKVFSSKGVQVDDITWNPHRGSLVNDRFSVHSIRVTVGEWQKTLYQIEMKDILDYADGKKPIMITLRIKELAEIYHAPAEVAGAAGMASGSQS
jgi:hypothetical protein